MKCEPLIKYQASSAEFNLGYTDIIMNPQGTLLYAHGTDNVIYCFPLGSTYRGIIYLKIYIFLLTLSTLFILAINVYLHCFVVIDIFTISDSIIY